MYPSPRSCRARAWTLVVFPVPGGPHDEVGKVSVLRNRAKADEGLFIPHDMVEGARPVLLDKGNLEVVLAAAARHAAE